jgi:hypothetical protein
MVGFGAGIFFLFIYVAIKHRETDEESNADKIFHAFDVRVIIDQGKHFLKLT